MNKRNAKTEQEYIYPLTTKNLSITETLSIIMKYQFTHFLMLVVDRSFNCRHYLQKESGKNGDEASLAIEESAGGGREGTISGK